MVFETKPLPFDDVAALHAALGKAQGEIARLRSQLDLFASFFKNLAANNEVTIARLNLMKQIAERMQAQIKGQDE